ncbi:molecular chaperone DnaJ [Splendidivirga corallicola]
MLFAFAHAGYAQNPVIIDQEVRQLMDRAIEEMESGKYQKANTTFREMLDTKKVLPSNMSYLFSKTLYMIEQYHNSKNFLDKYLDLTGKAGDYYEEALALKRALNENIEEIKSCNFCNIFGYRLEHCDVCDGHGSLKAACYYCRGIGKTNCPTCLGKGVIITKNQFDVEEYESCHTCQTVGNVTCKVCSGKKVIDSQCPQCLGSGRSKTKEICDHLPHEHKETKLDN